MTGEKMTCSGAKLYYIRELDETGSTKKGELGPEYEKDNSQLQELGFIVYVEENRAYNSKLAFGGCAFGDDTHYLCKLVLSPETRPSQMGSTGIGSLVGDIPLDEQLLKWEEQVNRLGIKFKKDSKWKMMLD
jgi:hypothetical protein